MKKISISAFFLLLMAIMPTILVGCTKCNAENNVSKRMKDKKQEDKVMSFTEETDGIRFILNGVEFKMIKVEGGTFTMGHNSRQANERPEHQVTLTSYLIGETEVTQPLWTEVMGSNPSYRKGSNYPVENVTWKRCHDFVDRLNERMHAEKLISDDWNFHMPSEAQWEYAAKGGNQSKGFIYSGSDNQPASP